VNISEIYRRLSASRFVRFAVVGGAGFFVNEAALLLAKELLKVGDHAGWFIAFVPAVTFTWWGNRTITFADKASSHHIGILAEWARFVATNSLGAAANFVVYSLLIGFAPWPLDIAYIALAAGILVGLVFNFTLSKKLVFRGS
jgi:putative flippase GtrA